MVNSKIALFSVLLLSLFVSAAGWASCTPGARGGAGDQYCGSFSHACIEQSAGEFGIYACSVNDVFHLCNTACSAGAVNYGQCVCVHNDDGTCTAPSQCYASSHSRVGGSCSINGQAGETWTCQCPSCSNTLTYCKEVGSPVEPSAEPTIAPPSGGGGGGGGWWTFPPYCSLTAYPQYVYAGSSSEITVTYYNLFYPPWAVFVDCGNGYSSYAFGCYGTTGFCYATCSYPQQGTFYVNAYAGGNFCYPTVVHAIGGGSGPQPTIQPTATPQPTVYPSACSVYTNPSVIEGSGASTVTVSYTNFATSPSSATIICGNGASTAAQCIGTATQGSCIANCDYAVPASYPAYYRVDGLVNGLQCTPSGVTLVQGTQPSPQPRVCDLTAYVYDAVTNDPISTATVTINGEVQLTDANGETVFENMAEGDYNARASKIGYQSAEVTAHPCDETRVEIPLSPFLDKSCEVTVNPSTVRAGSSTIVGVLYDGFNPLPQTTTVDCGNGATAIARCTGSGASGVCTASCGYGVEQVYPVFYTVRSAITGTVCKTAQVKVVAALPDTGSLLAKVTDCDSGEALQGSRVDLSGTIPGDVPTTYYADQMGEALIGGLAGGSYQLAASHDGYSPATASGFVTVGRTTTVPICLRDSAHECDFGVEVIKAPTCPYNTEVQPYQLRITNNLNVSQDIFLTYSSDHLQGPGVVHLEAHGSTIVDLYSYITPDFAGGNFVMVTLTGADPDCTKNLQLPACMSGGLELQALENAKTSYSGQQVCYALLVRNRGTAKAAVTMGVTPYNTSGSGWEYAFTPSAFMIDSQETKNVEFCARVPGGVSGAFSFMLQAESPINDASAAVTLNVPGSADWNTDWSGCKTIDASSNVGLASITINNNAVSGNYRTSIGDNNLSLSTQENVYNFAKGESRQLWFRYDAFGLPAGSYHADFRLLSADGSVAFQQDLCFRIAGDYQVYSQLIPATIAVSRGAGASSFLKIKNLGRSYGIFDIVLPSDAFNSVYVAPTTIGLEPNQEESVELRVTPSYSTALGAYTIPVEVWVRGEVHTTYSGGSNANDAEFDCGNGYQPARTCYGTDGSCTVSCTYPNTGTFYPTASIAGYDCDDWAAQVQVRDTNADNACYVDVDDNNLQTGDYTSVRVRYYGSAISSPSATVNCGNGNTQTCTGSGTNSACTVSCYYPSQGDYSPSATLSTGSNTYSCSQARVVVSSVNGRSCALSASPNNALDGNSVTLTLAYYDMPEATTTLSTDYDHEFLDSNNLLVNVISSSGTQSYTPVVSSALQVIAASPLEITASGWSSVPVVVKNNNYYSLTSVILSVRGLPDGVYMQPLQPFDLAPNAEKTVQIYFQAQDAVPGTYAITLRADSANMVSPDAKVDLRVRSPVEGELNFAVQQSPVVSTTLDGAPALKILFGVTSNEAGAQSVTASVELPSGWNYVLSPQPPIMLAPGQSTQIQLTVLPGTGYDASNDYNATLVLRSTSAKQKRVAIDLKPQESLLSLGFFTLALSSELALAILAVFAIAGGYLLYEADRKLKEAEE
ncbi:hypothetical protein COY71_04660 [Candidatus Micrarchaeota archaeon CG_4_10_14_0_8_um_filter_60_7]|nr:MAG: hypothetical protein COY71_04660 [Candidatus Micrarchaeota archaeon CG_4_10_14_0_8_um_filter_60_7]